MSAEQAVMRTTLVPGLLAGVAANLAQQTERVAMFEQGRVYLPRRDGELPTPSKGPDEEDKDTCQPWPVDEPEMLGIALCGPVVGESWAAAPRPTDFYTLKGFVERLLAGLQIPAPALSGRPSRYLHPGKAATLLLGGERSAPGLLRPDVAARYGIETGPSMWPSSPSPCWPRAAWHQPVRRLLTFPPASQDLAVVLDAGVPAAEVLAVVRKAGGKLLREAQVFDVYEGDQVPAGKRSLAVRLLMRSPDRTLTDKTSPACAIRCSPRSNAIWAPRCGSAVGGRRRSRRQRHPVVLRRLLVP